VDERTVGEILIDLGRITEADVARALEYQRENGGYFGEALVACGFVSEEELEWSLASQFDLPYVFPEADSIDPEAAAVVSPEWALANLALPILMTDDTLTVIVESPLKTGAVEELRARTEREVQLALASSSKIRELIRQVYARGAAADEEHRAPIDVTESLDQALEVESGRFGISVRGARSSVWWDDRGTIRRRPLAGDWTAELDRMMSPGPSQRTRGKLRTHWDAELNRVGIVTPLTVHYLADESGCEYLFQPRAVEAFLEERFSPPPAGILSEVRLLARSGEARFIVTGEPGPLGHEVLPHLPTLLLDPTWRSIHLHARDDPPAREAFSVTMPHDPEDWSQELEALRAFHFDVVTVDLMEGDRDWAKEALDVASIAFLLWKVDEDEQPAYDAGIRWRLHIVRVEGDQLEWSLAPLHG
jgi:type IV pilus assembly protein PilB